MAAVGAAVVVLATLTACDTTPAVLQGAVTTTSGTPVFGSSVTLYADDAETVVASTSTVGLEGRYSFRRSQVPDGTYRLRVGDQWWDGATSWADATPVTLTGGVTDIDVSVPEVGSLSGTVVDADGAPVPGTRVIVVRAGDGVGVAYGVADVQGTYRLGLSQPGDHRVLFAPPDSSSAVTVGGDSPKVFTVEDGEVPVGTIDIATGLPYLDDPGAITAGGSSHACALLDDSSVACWGYNDRGQLGNGTTNNSTFPTPVTGLTDATALTTGFYHSCALRSDGTVACWGSNESGQLGDGTTTDSSTPVPVTGIHDATSVISDSFHTCALRSDGTIACWGANVFGELGNGTTTDSSTPVPVAGIGDATALEAGYSHTCALRSDGTIACWGANVSGELGNGTTTGSSTPVTVTGITDATAVTAGGFFTCALRSNRTTACWGANGLGQLGNGTTTGSLVPVTVIGI